MTRCGECWHDEANHGEDGRCQAVSDRWHIQCLCKCFVVEQGKMPV